jgi:PPOX class probable F420-dependent enzyme
MTMPSLETYRARLESAPFAVLATHGPDRRLDLVPCCFALDEASGFPELVTAVDHKPKRHQRLARLANVEADPHVSLLIDHRNADDWSALWWIRVHGLGRVVTTGTDHASAVAALVAKYAQYRQQPPQGPVIRIAPRRWAGWTP